MKCYYLKAGLSHWGFFVNKSACESGLTALGCLHDLRFCWQFLYIAKLFFSPHRWSDTQITPPSCSRSVNIYVGVPAWKRRVHKDPSEKQQPQAQQEASLTLPALQATPSCSPAGCLRVRCVAGCPLLGGRWRRGSQPGWGVCCWTWGRQEWRETSRQPVFFGSGRATQSAPYCERKETGI